jgi:hypothetical protein
MARWLLGWVNTTAMAPVMLTSSSSAAACERATKTVTHRRSDDTRQPSARTSIGMFETSREAAIIETPP